MTVEEMLALEVPAPFVKGQKLALRHCTKEDVENACKVLVATDGNANDIILLRKMAHDLRRLSHSSVLTQATFAELEALAKFRASQQQEPKPKSGKKSKAKP